LITEAVTVLLDFDLWKTRWRWLNDGQYRHVTAMVAEISKLLGGWMNAA
jgi:hypothetical protein